MESNLIDRQAAIDAIENLVSSMSVCINVDEYNGMRDMKYRALKAINELPSAQPDHTAEVSKMVGQTAKTTQNVPNDDSISRKAAIEAINTWDKFGVDERSRVVRWCEGLEPYVRLRDVVTSIANLPSAQQEIIRCGECTHKDKEIDYCHCLGITICERDFCSFAKRREDG